MDAAALTDGVASVFAADPNVAAVYLFGSRARGSHRQGSDVDLAVLYRTPVPPTLAAQPFEQQAELSRLLETSVDIVVMNTAPVDLIHRILRDGKLVFERDKSRRIAFEVKARNEYFDLMPVLRRYRRASA